MKKLYVVSKNCNHIRDQNVKASLSIHRKVCMHQCNVTFCSDKLNLVLASLQHRTSSILAALHNSNYSSECDRCNSLPHSRIGSFRLQFLLTALQVRFPKELQDSHHLPVVDCPFKLERGNPRASRRLMSSRLRSETLLALVQFPVCRATEILERVL